LFVALFENIRSALNALDNRDDYIKALEDSWDLDGDDKKPLSAERISAICGLPILALEQRLVIASKRTAIVLLRDLGLTNGDASIKKKLNERRYERIFQRDATYLNNKLVFTYAEVAIMWEFKDLPALPDDLATD